MPNTIQVKRQNVKRIPVRLSRDGERSLRTDNPIPLTNGTETIISRVICFSVVM